MYESVDLSAAVRLRATAGFPFHKQEVCIYTLSVFRSIQVQISTSGKFLGSCAGLTGLASAIFRKYYSIEYDRQVQQVQHETVK